MDYITRLFNAVVALIQLAGVALLFVTDRPGRLYPVHLSVQSWIDCARNANDDPDWCNSTVNTQTYARLVWLNVNLGWIISGVLAWSALINLVSVTALWSRYQSAMVDGRRWRLRWIDYAVSVTVAQTMVTYLLGVNHMVTLLFVAMIVSAIYALPAVTALKGNMKLFVLAEIVYVAIWTLSLAQHSMISYGVLPVTVLLYAVAQFVLQFARLITFAVETKNEESEGEMFKVDCAYQIIVLFSAVSLVNVVM